MIKAMLLDLDGTLFDRDTAVRGLFEEQHRAFGDELGGVTREAFVERLVELDGHGHADKRTIFLQAVRELGVADAIGQRLLAHFRGTYPRFGQLFADVAPTLAELRRRGIALAVVTNGRTDTQQAKIERLGLEPLLDAVLISEREGVRKPDVKIFANALERLGVEASAAWHVGDHPMVDVAGAHAAGLTAVWRYVPYWPEPATCAHTIHAFAELLPLVDAAR
jgi:putative hydrolase of the HAD superfamily